ncbi:hypothetical protein ACFFNY_18650 [Paenibacillus hodogayensis]|uniref:Rpn family recombination-promoting nuclease/putative transposase n=2 Tax=Paenibacillus hodogayensis TaxID=279208 RepID=A0ABV5VZH6_9BACL
MLKKAMDTLEFLSQDAETRLGYESRLKFLRDEASRIQGAKEEGKTEGEKRKAEQIALNMLSMGYSVSDIAKITELSEADIQALKKQ